MFVNLVGGIADLPRPPDDLPVVLALASSLGATALDPGQLVAFGELGLTGEVRPVPYGDERLRECASAGLSHRHRAPGRTRRAQRQPGCTCIGGRDASPRRSRRRFAPA